MGPSGVRGVLHDEEPSVSAPAGATSPRRRIISRTQSRMEPVLSHHGNLHSDWAKDGHHPQVLASCCRPETGQPGVSGSLSADARRDREGVSRAANRLRRTAGVPCDCAARVRAHVEPSVIVARQPLDVAAGGDGPERRGAGRRGNHAADRWGNAGLSAALPGRHDPGRGLIGATATRRLCYFLRLATTVTPPSTATSPPAPIMIRMRRSIPTGLRVL